MTFGLTSAGFKLKRLEDIKSEMEQDYRETFGQNVDLSSNSPFGQIIGIHAEREAKIWELAQSVYNSQYRQTSEGRSLDNVLAITGTTRRGPEFSRVESGVAFGDNETIVSDGTIVSVPGNTNARFVVQGDHEINIPDGPTFKAENITLIAENFGPIKAVAGTLTKIETPISGLNSFTNLLDATEGSNTETDPEAKARGDQELQIAGASTIEAIKSELSARENVQAVIVFQNKTATTDSEGRPPHHLDIVVEGDDEDDLAAAIFEVTGGGIGMVGDISRTVIDSQGFDQEIKFSRPTDVPIFVEIDLTKDVNEYPIDGDDQVKAAIVAHGSSLGIGKDVVVYGYNSLIAVFNDIPGILDVAIRVGKAINPISDDNVDILAREKSAWDTSRVVVN